jgi:hypothetical protein
MVTEVLPARANVPIVAARGWGYNRGTRMVETPRWGVGDGRSGDVPPERLYKGATAKDRDD